jgi:hypothetical protein
MKISLITSFVLRNPVWFAEMTVMAFVDVHVFARKDKNFLGVF